MQSSRVIASLKKLVTGRVLEMLNQLAREDQDGYLKFWEAYQRALKQGVAVEPDEPEKLYPLLRIHTTAKPDEWSSLDDYLERMPPDQKDIYYLLGDDPRSLRYSPHLDIVRGKGYEVLLLTDPLDSFVLVRLNKYKDYPLTNLASSDLSMPEGQGEAASDQAETQEFASYKPLIERFKGQLGEKVSEVRLTNRLSDAPARLVDPQGALNQEMQRVYRLLNKEYQVPLKVLEINPRHPILARLNSLPVDDPRTALIIDQLFEDALLIEGLHPDPASMINRIQKLMESALE